MDSPSELSAQVKSFFESAPPLSDSNAILGKIEEFIARNRSVCEKYAAEVNKAISSYRAAVDGGKLLKLQFTSIFEYLQILKIVAASMKSLDSLGMVYLAAAVSDFYVPWESMAEHKIQSAGGPLDMRLAPVPKMLSLLRKEWAPMAFCISFKLETDSEILLKKADAALRRYGMHVVVANELSTRKREVVVVTETGKVKLRIDDAHKEVEEKLIEVLVDHHSNFIAESTKASVNEK